MFITRGGRTYNLLILVVAVGANRIRPVYIYTELSRGFVPGYHRCGPETASQATIAALSTAFLAGSHGATYHPRLCPGLPSLRS